jgi:BlaI family penicillinase repressor
MSDEPTPLSRAEWKLMNHCWNLGRATAKEIHEASLTDRKRDYQTIKTLLDRMVAKGWLEMNKVGPVCVYSPAVARRKAMAAAVKDFVNTILDRELSPLYLHLADDENLSEAEAELLRSMVGRKKES